MLKPPNRLSGSHPFAAWGNSLRDFAASCAVKSSPGVKVSRGPNGTILGIQPGVGGAPPSPGILQQFWITAIYDNYLKCVAPVPGGPLTLSGKETAIYIAKPVKLRQNYAQAFLEGDLAFYFYALPFAPVAGIPNQYMFTRRTATTNTLSTVFEYQVIVPHYSVCGPTNNIDASNGFIVHAMKTQGGTGLQTNPVLEDRWNANVNNLPDPGTSTRPAVNIDWQDVNVDSRAWATQFQQSL